MLLTKEEELQKIYQAYAVDPAFEKLRQGVNLVPGYGPLNAKVVLVGQAPGRSEDEKRRPFAGRSGKNLAALFENTGYHVEQTFRTELVKYWPNSEATGKKTFTRSELEASFEYLKKEIEVINPVYVGLMGRTVLSLFYPELDQIFPVVGGVLDGKYVPLYDPAYVLHRPNKWPLVHEGFKNLARMAANV